MPINGKNPLDKTTDKPVHKVNLEEDAPDEDESRTVPRKTGTHTSHSGRTASDAKRDIDEESE